MKRQVEALALLGGLAGVGLLAWFMLSPEWESAVAPRTTGPGAPAPKDPDEPPDVPVPIFSAGFVDDSGFTLTNEFRGRLEDRRSLEAAYAFEAEAADRAIAATQAQLDALPDARQSRAERDDRRGIALMSMGLIHMSSGRFAEAERWFEEARDAYPEWRAQIRANLGVMRGIAAMRRGEIENCIECQGPSSCIYPLDSRAAHQFRDGSETAQKHYQEYLAARPEDLGVRWLLNVVAMTLNEYPDGVPGSFRVGLPAVDPAAEMPRFENVAHAAGLTTRGPNMYGGSVFDDFNGDGKLDLFVCSHDWDRGASLFVNRGDQTFEDRGPSAGLDGQRLSQNLSVADYDNDGDSDVFLTRGGWQYPRRQTLLRNRGDGTFDDVTVEAGLDAPIACHSAQWADYDRDGDLDVYLVGEMRPGQEGNPERRSRLHRNEGNGRFSDQTDASGVGNDRWAKGCAWGDYDGDGRPDLFVSNWGSANRLYHNEGDGTFRDLASSLGVTEPLHAFSCWFWDYDNDGRLDLFVSGYKAWLNDVIADRMGRITKGERPRLYRNEGEAGFRDVTAEVGLDHVWLPMGSNVGDVDNDGDLDVYLATGLPPTSHLMPNVLLRNEGGRRFVDATIPSGTGHLQKGHGVTFGDYDEDGDLDLFVQTGGTSPGDRGHNALFRNPGFGGHWLSVRLEGTKSARDGRGAKVRAEVVGPDGERRVIHRVAGMGSSYGGTSTRVHLGLGAADRVSRLEVEWPSTGIVQSLTDVEADRTITVTEAAPRASEADGADVGGSTGSGAP